MDDDEISFHRSATHHGFGPDSWMYNRHIQLLKLCRRLGIATERINNLTGAYVEPFSESVLWQQVGQILAQKEPEFRTVLSHPGNEPRYAPGRPATGSLKRHLEAARMVASYRQQFGISTDIGAIRLMDKNGLLTVSVETFQNDASKGRRELQRRKKSRLEMEREADLTRRRPRRRKS